MGLQAARWLRADLAAWNAALDGGRATEREALRRTLTGWRFDPDLEGLRDQAALN